MKYFFLFPKYLFSVQSHDRGSSDSQLVWVGDIDLDFFFSQVKRKKIRTSVYIVCKIKKKTLWQNWAVKYDFI